MFGALIEPAVGRVIVAEPDNQVSLGFIDHIGRRERSDANVRQRLGHEQQPDVKIEACYRLSAVIRFGSLPCDRISTGSLVRIPDQDSRVDAMAYAVLRRQDNAWRDEGARTRGGIGVRFCDSNDVRKPSAGYGRSASHLPCISRGFDELEVFLDPRVVPYARWELLLGPGHAEAMQSDNPYEQQQCDI